MDFLLSNPAILKQKFTLMNKTDFVASARAIAPAVASLGSSTSDYYRRMALTSLLGWCRIFYKKKYCKRI